MNSTIIPVIENASNVTSIPGIQKQNIQINLDDSNAVVFVEISSRSDEGPLTPVHYIIIVLIIYMGGIAVLIMKSVQKDNEVQRYAQYYENFVKRPQFSRPQLLPSCTLKKASYKSRIDRGSSTPSQVETIPDAESGDVFPSTNHNNYDSISATAECSYNYNSAAYHGRMCRESSFTIVKAMPASTQTEETFDMTTHLWPKVAESPEPSAV